jgi:hypothetical protein
MGKILACRRVFHIGYHIMIEKKNIEEVSEVNALMHKLNETSNLILWRFLAPQPSHTSYKCLPILARISTPLSGHRHTRFSVLPQKYTYPRILHHETPCIPIMSDTSGTSQNAKRITTAVRRIPTLDTLAAEASTIRESGLKGVEGLKERLALTFWAPEVPVTVRKMSPKLGDGEETQESKRRDPNQNHRRKMHAHETYLRALSKGCHFFFVFLLLTAPRTCAEHKKQIDQLLVPEDTSRYHFSLSNDCYDLLDSWAKDDQYDDNPRYHHFSRVIRHPETAELEDFQTLERIFRERGVYESPQSIEIIKLLFPGCMFPPTAHLK